MKNIGIILAGGSGIRSGFEKPKQLVKLAGKPVISHTLKTLNSSEHIDEIAIVCNRDSIEEIHQIVNSQAYSKVKKILFGGYERWESSWSAIEAYANVEGIEDANFIFHDAVRPLLDESIIQNVVHALNEHNAVDVVINTVDTIVEVDESSKFIGKILDRSKLRNGQTPQGFKYSLIREAYLKAFEDKNFKVTDDCGIVAKYYPSEKIFLVSGNSFNQKLTYNEDLTILEKLFQFKRSVIDSKLDSDFISNLIKNNKDKVYVVFGGTSGIGEEICKTLKSHGANVYSCSRKTNCDIQRIEDVKTFLDGIFKQHGRIDYVVNCSGILLKQPLALMSYEDIINSVNTNFLGAVNVAYSSFEYLKQSQGSLLLFTSSSYTYGRAFYSIYSSSKAAVVNFTQAIAEEWTEFGIKVNCLNPERTLTPMRLSAFGKEDPDTLLTANEVANASIKTILENETGLVIDVKRKL